MNERQDQVHGVPRLCTTRGWHSSPRRTRPSVYAQLTAMAAYFSRSGTAPSRTHRACFVRHLQQDGDSQGRFAPACLSCAEETMCAPAQTMSSSLIIVWNVGYPRHGLVGARESALRTYFRAIPPLSSRLWLVLALLPGNRSIPCHVQQSIVLAPNLLTSGVLTSRRKSKTVNAPRGIGRMPRTLASAPKTNARTTNGLGEPPSAGECPRRNCEKLQRKPVRPLRKRDAWPKPHAKKANCSTKHYENFRRR